MMVLGGKPDESVDDAITDVAALNNEHVVRLSGGYFRDDVLGTSGQHEPACAARGRDAGLRSVTRTR